MANKNFKARIGIEAPLIAADNGTTAITLSDNDVTIVGDLTITSNTIKSNTGATAISLNAGDVTISGDLAVNGGDITTTQTTASLFNSTATTVNIGAGGTLAVNLGNANGSIVKGANRYTSPTVAGFAGGGTSSSRGLSISNGNGSSAALARNALVLRTYPTSGGARSQVLFENARGTETTPTAIQNNDLVGEVSMSGYATNGWVSDYVTAVPGVTYFTPTENWANSGGPYPTAGTVTNAGAGYIVALQPTATSLTSGNGTRINVLNINPQTFNQRSDTYTWNKGKTNSSSMASLSDDGTGKIGFSVIQPRATASTNFALVNFNTYRSADGVNYTPTQSNDALGSFKFNGNANTSTSPGVPGGPGVEIQARATENWSATANGTKVNFFAIKTGTLDSYNVISATPDVIQLNATTLDLNSFDGTTPLVGNQITYNRVYGQWQYDATITPAAANTGYAIPFQGTNAAIDFANIATASNTSQIRPNALGMYKMQFSAQVENSDNGQDHQITFWWRKNGTDITNSAGYFTVPKAGVANGSLIVGWDNMVEVTTVTDYFELIYAVNNTAVTLPYVAASAPRPGAAAVFLTLIPIGA